MRIQIARAVQRHQTDRCKQQQCAGQWQIDMRAAQHAQHAGAHAARKRVDHGATPIKASPPTRRQRVVVEYEPGIENLACDRRSIAGAAVSRLECDDDRNTRIVRRRETFEQHLVTLVRRSGNAGPGFIGTRIALGRAGLAGDHVRETITEAACRATGTVHDADHALLDRIPGHRVVDDGAKRERHRRWLRWRVKSGLDRSAAHVAGRRSPLAAIVDKAALSWIGVTTQAP